MTDLTRNIALLIYGLASILAGCSTASLLERSLQKQVPDLQIHRKGDAHFVVTKEGNLVGATVFSMEERQIQLEEFINKYKAEFGIRSNGPVLFVRQGSEFDLELTDRVLTGLPLLQSVNGLRILELDQLGVFDLESGSLKAAKIHVADPDSFKDLSMPKHTDTIPSLAAQFLRARGTACSPITVIDEPAYSLAAGMAGFEARCTARPNSQYFTRLRLLVNTDSGRVVMLSREEIDLPLSSSHRER